MNYQEIRKILKDTAYSRIGGSIQEQKCADYIKEYCLNLGLEAKIEPFDIKFYNDKKTYLNVNGKDIPCKSYWGSASGNVTAEICYLEDTSTLSLKKCKNRIVLLDKTVGKQTYKLLQKNGAIGFITYSGNLNDPNNDISLREIRYNMPLNERLFCVNINVKDAMFIAENGITVAKLIIDQEATVRNSQNVVVEIPGKTDNNIIISAHYDSTYLSHGAYDNMSGCIVLLYLAEILKSKQLEKGIKLLWCGSEERGLIGSLEYCKKHQEELKQTCLNINLDMLGSKMGGFVAFSCANEQILDLLNKFLVKNKYCGTTKYAIRSSDSNSFLKYGVPAISFARYAPSSIVQIHTSDDTSEAISVKKLSSDMKIIGKFTEYFTNMPNLAEIATISDKIKSELNGHYN